MKKIIIALFAAVMLTGCGVGNYSLSSGRAEEAFISFTTLKTTPITVTIDDTVYQISSVKDKTWKTDRKIKKTAQNTIRLAPGTHDVKVQMKGEEVYSHKLVISLNEHRVIEL